MKITIVRPKEGHKAYEIAANIFAEMCQKVSNTESVIITDEEFSKSPAQELTVLIGSDSVNNVTADLYLTGKTDSFKIRYCTDDYCIRTACANGKSFLIIPELSAQYGQILFSSGKRLPQVGQYFSKSSASIPLKSPFLISFT